MPTLPSPTETASSDAGPSAPHAGRPPEVSLTALDQLWFQVSGTVCNLRCRHCFISCAPDNHSFWFLERRQVQEALETSIALGVKEYYFTGGEPFMHPELLPMLADALALGPATVLTNGTLLPARRVAALARIAEGSPYSLEVRLSLDGVSAEANDAIRGEGTFRRALEGLERLVAAGFLPILTCMKSWPDEETEGHLAAFHALLHGLGYHRPRLKLIPPLRIGAEANRSRPYGEEERVTHEMLHGFDLDRLLCTRGRVVTSRGVWACPILLDAPAARVAATLAEAAARPVALGERACWTCWAEGALCTNLPATGSDR